MSGSWSWARRVMERGISRSSIRSAGPCATCASPSPTAATSAARTACPRRACSGCPATSCSPSRRSSGWPAVCVERFGFEGIRLTGGEPTVRAHLPGAGRAESGRPCGVDLAMTTNGATLSAAGRRPAPRPACAGSTSPRLAATATASPAITRRDALDQVLDGIDAAVDAGFDPVKINCVVVRGVNDDEIVDFAAFGRERGVERALHRVHAARRAAATGGSDQVVPASRDRRGHRRRCAR